MNQEKEKITLTWMLYNKIDNFTLEQKKICSKGCHYCCHQPIEILDAEIPILKQAISTLTKEQKERVKVRAHRWMAYFNAITPIEPLTMDQTYFDFTYKDPANHMDCPFLEDKACMIYDYRPSPCRLHYQESNLQECKNNTIRAGVLDAVNFAKNSIVCYLEYLNEINVIHYQRAILMELDPDYPMKKVLKSGFKRQGNKLNIYEDKM